MFEIDCSGLPEDAAKVGLEAAEDILVREEIDHGVDVIYSASVVTVNTDDRELFGRLEQAVTSSIRKYLRENQEQFSEEELEAYWANGVVSVEI